VERGGQGFLALCIKFERGEGRGGIADELKKLFINLGAKGPDETWEKRGSKLTKMGGLDGVGGQSSREEEGGSSRNQGCEGGAIALLRDYKSPDSRKEKKGSSKKKKKKKEGEKKKKKKKKKKSA